MRHDAGEMAWVLILSLLYFVPTLIAAARNAEHGGGISLVNLLLGWTVVGWIIALVWAVSDREHDTRPRRDCPFCGERVLAIAQVCPHCQRQIAGA